MILLYVILLGWASVVSAIPSRPYIVEQATLVPTTYQKWAHLHWVWLENGQGNQENVTNLIDGYKENYIPVGAVNIDSTWATYFNNFVVDTDKFPDFAGLVNSIHNQDMKIILWATSMVNTDNPDYDMAVENNYLIRDSRGFVRPLKWWHDSGGLIDYTNPEAVAWWHQQMDKVLDITGDGTVGVDGFKCDGTDPYILEYELAGGAMGYNNQSVSYKDYAYSYYRDFFYHTRDVRGKASSSSSAGLIMSRPVDCEISQASKGCLAFSPPDVMTSGWVGDDDPTFNGLRGATRKSIFSAWAKYANFGCDIGGYRGNSGTKDKHVFLRWAQLGAFLPLMENGGGGEHRPWMYDQETADIYRTFAQEHHRLAAYLLTTGSNAIDSNTSTVRPVDVNEVDPRVDASVMFRQPTTFSYRLGQDVLVHPVVYDAKDFAPDSDSAATTDTSMEGGLARSTNTTGLAGIVDMVFPYADDKSAPAIWLDWWRPTDRTLTYRSGMKARRVVSIDTYPVYVRQGSLIPLETPVYSVDSTSTSTSTGEEWSGSKMGVVFTWFGPVAGPDSGKAEYHMREADSGGVTAAMEFTVDNGQQAHEQAQVLGSIDATVSADPIGNREVGVAIIGVSRPTAVDITAWEGARCRQRYDVARQSLTVTCGSGEGGLNVRVHGVKSTF